MYRAKFVRNAVYIVFVEERYRTEHQRGEIDIEGGDIQDE